MSRIGKLPVFFKPETNVLIDSEILRVSGAKGTLSLKLDKNFEYILADTTIDIRPVSQIVDKNTKALHGLYRSLLYNMVYGVENGYSVIIELIGVGFKAELKGKDYLEFNIGYSHSIFFILPEEVKVEVVIGADKIYRVKLDSIDKQLLGQIVAKMKAMRKTEPYKGRGVRIAGEFVRLKAGKTGSKK